MQKWVAFLYTNNEQSEKDTRKSIPFTIAWKNKVPKNKINEGSEGPIQCKL
jgi:hypothetical protein